MNRISNLYFQADDKSILARFYYADRALTAVASELDSFDGRAEPERCSRLVARLRQGQVNFDCFIYTIDMIFQPDAFTGSSVIDYEYDNG